MSMSVTVDVEYSTCDLSEMVKGSDYCCTVVGGASTSDADSTCIYMPEIGVLGFQMCQDILQNKVDGKTMWVPHLYDLASECNGTTKNQITINTLGSNCKFNSKDKLSQDMKDNIALCCGAAGGTLGSESLCSDGTSEYFQWCMASKAAANGGMAGTISCDRESPVSKPSSSGSQTSSSAKASATSNGDTVKPAAKVLGLFAVAALALQVVL